ncbi:MAG: sigma-70 family RNA polymerase sigma factor [Bacteroidota bacterium]
MSAKHFDCISCIQDIYEGGKKREEGVKKLYEENFKLVGIHAHQYNGSLSYEEVRDAYTDSILAFMINVLSGKYQEEGNCFAYLKRIHKNKCVDRIRKRPNPVMETLEEWLLPDTLIIEAFKGKEDNEQLLCYIRYLEEACQAVLLHKYFWGYNNSEIATLLAYKNANTVGSKAFTCRQKLSQLMKNPEINC